MPVENSQNAWAELRRGNADALLGLYREHYIGMLNYGIKLTGDHQLTKDCITQTLLNLHRNSKRLPEVTNIRSYLLTSLRNEIFGFVRTENRKRELEQRMLIELSEKSYEEHLVSIQSDLEVKERLRKALKSLSDRERELLEKRFFEDTNYDEISRDCNITKRTAYNIINTALKRLKSELMSTSKKKLIYISILHVLASAIL